MKRTSALIGGSVVAASIAAVTLIGCEAQFTTASLSEATMCENVNERMQPIAPTNVFTTDTPEIFCSVKLSNAPSDTEVKAEWIYVKGELEGVEDHLLADYSVIAEGTRYLSFSFASPDAGWPRGEYEVIFHVDGKEALNVPFTVQ